jgi:hypothetical protein
MDIIVLDTRVEASNSCVRTLIFGSFSFIVFLPVFFIHPFLFFSLVFYCQCFILCFLALVVPSLATSLPQLAWD